MSKRAAAALKNSPQSQQKRSLETLQESIADELATLQIAEQEARARRDADAEEEELSNVAPSQLRFRRTLKGLKGEKEWVSAPLPVPVPIPIGESTI